jgi:dethiobiotin synthetase
LGSAEPPARVVLVTGTGTGVGKTFATAALAARALDDGHRVAVVKPVQTAGDEEPGDVATVRRLLGNRAGLSCHEFERLPEPLAPQAAARRAGVVLPPLEDHAGPIAALAAQHELVLVEGAGGVLVRLSGTGREGGTIADLGALVAKHGVDVGAVVVTWAGLGTLNVTELTVEALRARGVPVLGLVVGRWPARPSTVDELNVADLPALTGAPLLGLVAAGGITVTPALRERA